MIDWIELKGLPSGASPIRSHHVDSVTLPIKTPAPVIWGNNPAAPRKTEHRQKSAIVSRAVSAP